MGRELHWTGKAEWEQALTSPLQNSRSQGYFSASLVARERKKKYFAACLGQTSGQVIHR